MEGKKSKIKEVNFFKKQGRIEKKDVEVDFSKKKRREIRLPR